MRGLGWLRELRLAEAQQIRDRIASLEVELISAAAAKGKFNLGHQLRSQKARLGRLEQCIAWMPKRL
ncbi:MAG: hypothetical protein E5V66_16850 [Mesorhizobium sp.]|nr:hypothetical protein EOA29_18340 [Mesorhizobium sp. M1E.F.Ca.ET.063.01.1.1]TIW10737.1 MAG: hypothetical protein E5V66_16850 [Mesorhizobium sp.]